MSSAVGLGIIIYGITMYGLTASKTAIKESI